MNPKDKNYTSHQTAQPIVHTFDPAHAAYWFARAVKTLQTGKAARAVSL